MKRDNVFGVWQRCRVCGTVFPTAAELREHLQAHSRKPIESTDELKPDAQYKEDARALNRTPLIAPS